MSQIQVITMLTQGNLPEDHHNIVRNMPFQDQTMVLPGLGQK